MSVRRRTASAAGIAAAGIIAVALPLASGTGVCAQPLAPIRIVADAIPASLTGQPGDPARGRAIVTDRTRGLCILCHSGPFGDPRALGSLAPSLAGAGSRSSPGQLRLRLVDGRKLSPNTIMPSYGSLEGLDRVGAAWRGRTILTAAEIEDAVAFLATLKE